MRTINIKAMSRPIRNIHALNRSIHELKDKRKVLEGRLEQNFQHLGSNYVNMGLNSFFGGKKAAVISGLTWPPGLWKAKNYKPGWETSLGTWLTGLVRLLVSINPEF